MTTEMKTMTTLIHPQLVLPPAPREVNATQSFAPQERRLGLSGAFLRWFAMVFAGANRLVKTHFSSRPTVIIDLLPATQVIVLESLLEAPCITDVLSDYTGLQRPRYAVAELRKLGLEIPCKMIQIRPKGRKKRLMGLYAFSAKDRRTMRGWKWMYQLEPDTAQAIRHQLSGSNGHQHNKEAV